MKEILRFVILAMSIVFIICSCEKDRQTSFLEESENSVTNIPASLSLTNAKLKFYESEVNSGNLFSGVYHQNINDLDCSPLKPIWNFSDSMTTNQGNDIIIVPLMFPKEEISSITGAQLVFYTTEECGLTYELVLYDAAESDELKKADYK